MSKNDKQSPMHQAIALLARRDHSVQEIKQKLLAKEHSEEVVLSVISDLKQRGYLDDRRYAQMIMRHHYSKGQGPQKIRYVLAQNGLPHPLIAEVFSEFEGDWFEMASEVRAKRFGYQLKSTDKNEQYKEKSRQMRFLMARGFEPDHIQYALGLIGSKD